MADFPEILNTKLTPPRLYAALVPRLSLLARLNEGLDRKLTLLSAPAGFGKTTLVSQWLAALRVEIADHSKIATRQSEIVNPFVAWLSLDQGDNDPLRFWRYLITACRRFQAGLGESALALLRVTPQPPVEAVLTLFINELAQFSGKYVLVLEDYHMITSEPIHRLVSFLLDHLPPALHLMITTRYDPPLPLARLRARNELNELHAADLRFSPAETQTFFRQAVPLSLSNEVVTRLEARTEGWAAGLRLVALALQGRPEAEQFLATFTGSHGHILEYLVEEVLGLQPEPVQTFLLQTTSLSPLTASLCNAVTGRSDSELILEQLHRANLFLIPLDGARQWYRYHALFAEAMQYYARRRLGEAPLLALYEKASYWYENHGFLVEAVETAFSAQAVSRAAHLMERFIEEHPAIEDHTLRRWMEQLPEPLRQLYPALCFHHAMAILFTANRRAPETQAMLEKPLQMAETVWQAEDNQPRLGRVWALRSLVAWWQGDINYAFAASRQSLELLPEHDIGWRGPGLITMAMGELFAGRLNPAQQLILEAQALCEAAQNIHAALAARFIRAEIFAQRGELRQAAQIAREVLAEASQIEIGEPHDDQAHALLSLGGLAYEWNELETAGQYVTQALDFSQQLGAEDLIVPVTLLLARLKGAAGEFEPAQQLLHALVAQTRQPHLLREVHAGQARLELMAGNLAAVQRWSARAAQPESELFLIQQEREAFIVARMLIAQGETEAAQRLLNPWQADARTQGRGRSELEVLVLKAIAFFVAGHLPQARQTLSQALALAQPEGYRRLFLDEGEKLAALLQTTLHHFKEAPWFSYGHSLLHDFTLEPSPGTPSSSFNLHPPIQNLIEPLTPREQQVLRLMAAGLSNPEIAEALIVSLNTVKTQAKSIYRKLDVHNRDDACDLARRLGLLQI